ncbi:MAG: glycosyltransferase [Candidatus Eremiobacteraeota bacterium]|nr:glycosyltransferase [Candidatus Eremiobacteraeota bacterium]
MSVIITSYNYAQYICTAIDSVLAQDYDNLEIVVTDNCSTDDTLRVLERYKSDPRIRLNVNAVNIGITPNINVGIGLARGEYVVILSADDWLLAGHLSRLVSVAERYPEAGFVYSTAYLCKDRSPDSLRYLSGQMLLDHAPGRDELGWLFGTCLMCLPTILFRRSLFAAHGLLDESFEVASDWEITVRMVLAGVKSAYVAAPLVGVRLHEDQASGVRPYMASGKDLREHLEILEKHYDSSAFQRVHGRELRIIQALKFRYDALQSLAPENLTEDLGIRYERALFRLKNDHRKRGTRKPPRVTVIVTSSGRVNLLGACLQSLAQQSYPHWDVWVLQDHGMALSGYAALHVPPDRFHYSRAFDRHGPASLRTQGLHVASGDYYLFLDEDTQLLPDHLAQLVAAAEAGDGVAVAGTIVQFDESQGLGWNPLGNTEGTYPLTPAPNDLLIANCLPISAVLFDAAAADALDNFDPSHGICAEWDALVRLSKLRKLAYTQKRTLVEHAFLECNGQALALQWPAYLDRMQALYERHPTNMPEVAALRERHRSAVAAVMRVGPGGYAKVENLFRLYGVLAGGGATPAVAGLSA